MDLSPIIKELLHTGGSAVVPGLGKFYTEMLSARMDLSRNLLIPPKQSLHFDKGTTVDDGKLAGLICARHGLTMANAMKAVSDFADGLRNELEAGRQASLSGIGILESSGDDIVFRPVEDEAALAGLLPNLTIPPKEKKEGEEVTKKRHEIRQVKKESHVIASVPVPAPADRNPERKSILWLPVTLVVLIVGLAAVLYFTGAFQSMRSQLGLPAAGNEDTAGNGNRMVFGKPPAGVDSGQEELSRQLDEMAAKENALAYHEPVNEARDMQPSGPSNPETETGNPSSDPESENVAGTAPTNGNAATMSGLTETYHIIAGSFRVPANAEKQKARLEQQGFSPSVIRPQDPYYMVSLDSFGSLEEATAALDRLRRQLDISLWVKKVE